MERGFHVLRNEGMDEEIAGALSETSQYLFVIVARENGDDWELRIGSEKVRNDSQTTIRSVVDFEEAEIRLLDGNGLGDLAPVGNYVQFSGCEIREITGQKWS